MGSIRLYGSTSGYLELQAPAVAPDSVLTLPSDSVQPGLVHLHTETFSAVSSVSIDNVFSAEYENYCVVWQADSSSTGADIRLRYRASGTDATSADYGYTTHYAFGATNSTSSGVNAYSTLSGSGTYYFAGSFEVIRPQVSAFTYLMSQSTNNARAFLTNRGVFGLTTSFDGFSFYATTGTLTGTLRVYGYRNA